MVEKDGLSSEKNRACEQFQDVFAGNVLNTFIFTGITHTTADNRNLPFFHDLQIFFSWHIGIFFSVLFFGRDH
jgi:hypothetical protein